MSRRHHSGWRQLGAAAQLAGAGFDRIAEQVQALHQAIADIPFTAVGLSSIAGPSNRAARTVHDGVARASYAAVRLSGRALFAAGARAFAVLDTTTVPLAPSRSGALDDVTSAVNGIVGDFMAARRNALAIEAGFYVDRRRLPLTRDAVAAVHPRPTDRLAVFVHGLCCNESAWQRYVDPEDPDTEPYATRLATDLGFTPYFARYNSGLHVSQNGRLLARALARLIAVHPVAVREIVLIGHSMGGLVSRAACHSALRTDALWHGRVSHVICLGAPHLGAPLERAVHVGSALMQLVPIARPVANVLNARSRGIQDLRYGFTADADWRGRDPQRHYRAARTRIRRLPGARYHFIGSTLGRTERDLFGRLLGDGLVRPSSSTAGELSDADTAILCNVHHVRLLNHPAVYREIRDRISGSPISRRRP